MLPINILIIDMDKLQIDRIAAASKQQDKLKNQQLARAIQPVFEDPQASKIAAIVASYAVGGASIAQSAHTNAASLFLMTGKMAKEVPLYENGLQEKQVYDREAREQVFELDFSEVRFLIKANSALTTLLVHTNHIFGRADAVVEKARQAFTERFQRLPVQFPNLKTIKYCAHSYSTIPGVFEIGSVGKIPYSRSLCDTVHEQPNSSGTPHTFYTMLHESGEIQIERHI